MAELVQERYAGALFDAALESGCEEQLKGELFAVSNILAEATAYEKLLSSPVIGKEEKKALVNNAFSGNLHPYLLNLFFVLIDNNRFSSFHEIAIEFGVLFDRHHNLLQIKAVTAVKLSEELFEKLRQKLCLLTNKNVMLQNVVDERLLGGVLLQYDNMEVDATVKSQLDAIKKQIQSKTV